MITDQTFHLYSSVVSRYPLILVEELFLSRLWQEAEQLIEVLQKMHKGPTYFLLHLIKVIAHFCKKVRLSLYFLEYDHESER